MTDVRRAEGPIVRAGRPTQPRRRVAGERTRPRHPSADSPTPAAPHPHPPLVMRYRGLRRCRDRHKSSPVARVAPRGRSRPRRRGRGSRGTRHPPGRPRGRGADAGGRTPSGWLLAALAVLLVLAVAGMGTLVLLDRRAEATQLAGGQAVRAAAPAATRILSYDYRHLDADFAAGKALTTGAFSGQYARTTGDAVRSLATQTKATVVAQVASTGVQQASADRVVVLLFVNQTTTSTAAGAASGRPEQGRDDDGQAGRALAGVAGQGVVARGSGHGAGTKVPLRLGTRLAAA